MNQLQTEILNNVWVAGTWQDYINLIDAPQYEEKEKSYYFNGHYRLQMTPIGSDHSCDHSVILMAVGYFIANNIKATTRDNCTYQKAGVIEVQPDISYHCKLETNNTQKINQFFILPGLSISLLKELLQKTRQMNQSQAIA